MPDSKNGDQVSPLVDPKINKSLTLASPVSPILTEEEFVKSKYCQLLHWAIIGGVEKYPEL